MISNLSDSPKQTMEIAGDFAKKIKPGDTVAIFGEMGAGKTHFIKGIAESFSFAGQVTSPTFNIVNEYETSGVILYHFDFYRLEDARDLQNIGFEEYLFAGGICLIEWAEKIKKYLPDSFWIVQIDTIDDTHREIRIIRE